MAARAAWVIAIIACLIAPAWQASATTVQDLVNQVSQTSYTSYITDSLYTHAGDNKGPGGAQHDACARSILLTMRQFGLTTYYDPFTYSGYNCKNVVGILPGVTRPDDIYIISGHYESKSNPGADDDASGVAAILEAARIMSKYHFEATIIFIAFDIEEEGMIGSTHYANAHKNDNILGMISIDMICYDTGDRFHANLWGADPLTTSLKSSLTSALVTYGGLTMNDSGAGGNYSDHNPFENVGKPGVMLTEWPKNYSMHTANDNVDIPGYMDYEFGTRTTRGVVAYLATAAGLIP